MGIWNLISKIHRLYTDTKKGVIIGVRVHRIPFRMSLVLKECNINGLEEYTSSAYQIFSGDTSVSS
jgi:hypothetical protein